MSRSSVGAVLVVGGGIGGIQTSLDLAESGFKVFLLEKNLSIGGTMAQLDKTFPTNDCSMCIMSPKLVDAGRHRNIEILTNARVEKVEGTPGNFKVLVHKKARYVRIEDCKACGECVKVCPVKIPNDYEQGLVTRAAVYQLFAQAMPSAYGIEKRGTPPCRAACPLHVNAQGYVALISLGKFKEALELVREKLPFPGILAYACSHPCEKECKRIEEDRAISICRLKRFLVDHVEEPESVPAVGNADLPARPAGGRSLRVAVIGGGPSGLTAAYDLRRTGYHVTIFESQNRLGGLLTNGFPSYRLPGEVVERDLSIIGKMGIEVHLGKKVGKDIVPDQLLGSYDAILLSSGAAGVESLVHAFKGLQKTGSRVPGPSSSRWPTEEGRRSPSTDTFGRKTSLQEGSPKAGRSLPWRAGSPRPSGKRGPHRLTW